MKNNQTTRTSVPLKNYVIHLSYYLGAPEFIGVRGDDTLFASTDLNEAEKMSFGVAQQMVRHVRADERFVMAIVQIITVEFAQQLVKEVENG